MNNFPWVTIKRFSELSGYTEKAIRNKIDRGVWTNGKHWTKSPDGRIQMNLLAIEQWITGIAA